MAKRKRPALTPKELKLLSRQLVRAQRAADKYKKDATPDWRKMHEPFDI